MIMRLTFNIYVFLKIPHEIKKRIFRAIAILEFLLIFLILENKTKLIDLVSMEGAAFAQSSVSPKIFCFNLSKKNFFIGADSCRHHFIL